MVEHNLAKVGVASSSLVFRSQSKTSSRLSKHRVSFSALFYAQVAELVDAHVSGACAARRAGSSPVLGTTYFDILLERWRNGRRATLRW